MRMAGTLLAPAVCLSAVMGQRVDLFFRAGLCGGLRVAEFHFNQRSSFTICPAGRVDVVWILGSEGCSSFYFYDGNPAACAAMG